MRRKCCGAPSRFAREGVIALLLCLAIAGSRIYALPDTDSDAAGGVPTATAAEREPGGLHFTQTIMPHIIYIGDPVTITVDIEKDPLPDDIRRQFSMETIDEDTLMSSGVEWTRSEDAFISSVRVTSPSQGDGARPAAHLEEGGDLTLIIELIPWKTGAITFNEINLSKVLALPLEDVRPLTLCLSPIEVHSLVRELGDAALRPPIPPILLPGTRYRIWLFTILGVLLFAALIITALNARKILCAVRTFLKECAQRRMSRATQRSLRRLLDMTFPAPRAGDGWRKSKLSSRAKSTLRDKALQSAPQLTGQEFACEWQSLMRRYLSMRFDRSFASVTAGAIGGMLAAVRALPDASSGTDAAVEGERGVSHSATEQNIAAELSELFVRTDRIRFAANTIDELPPLTPTEAGDIILESCGLINAFDLATSKGRSVSRFATGHTNALRYGELSMPGQGIAASTDRGDA